MHLKSYFKKTIFYMYELNFLCNHFINFEHCFFRIFTSCFSCFHMGIELLKSLGEGERNWKNNFIFDNLSNPLTRLLFTFDSWTLCLPYWRKWKSLNTSKKTRSLYYIIGTMKTATKRSLLYLNIKNAVSGSLQLAIFILTFVK